MNRQELCFLSVMVTLVYRCVPVQSEGCTGPLLLPDKPFFVVWNHPTVGCGTHGFPLGLTDWGIVDNTNDSFYGEDITLFYGIGKWPNYQNNGAIAVNGGLPQLGDISAHKAQITNDINEDIVDKSYTGLGVIDQEVWRPLWSLNWGAYGVYKTHSLQLARQRFPKLNEHQILAEAKAEFQNGARRYMQGTLEHVRSLRPTGQWGYYGYPRCWDTYCNTTTKGINDQLSYIFNISTGLYPSIYFDTTMPPAKRIFIEEKIRETLRIKAKHAPHNVTIFPYAENQNGAYQMYTKEDLEYAITEPANMGASGVVLWGSSNWLRAHDQCRVLQHYIKTTLGPFVMNVTNFFGNCSLQLCNGHGRCVRKDYERLYQQHLRESGRKTKCLMEEAQLSDSCSQESLEESDKSIRPGFDFNMEKHPKSKSDVLHHSFLPKRQKGIFNPLNWWNIGVAHYSKLNSIVKKMNIITSDKNLKLKLSSTSMHVNIKDNNRGANTEENVNLDSDTMRDKLNYNVPQDGGYDFDDYVCKCFDHWAGSRCSQPDQ